MGGRRKEEKKKREEEGIQGERKIKRKKKSSAGFKPVRLVLLVSCLCNRRGWGRIGFTFLPSWVTLFAVL